jgi:hypothetical protein
MKSDLELFGSLYSGEGQIEIWLVLIHESPLLGSDACYISSVRWIKKKIQVRIAQGSISTGFSRFLSVASHTRFSWTGVIVYLSKKK